jgi:hypothetical protein
VTVRSLLRIFLVVTIALAGTACAKSEGDEPDPGAFRIAKAVITNLLSNSVEASEETEAAPAPPAAPAPAPVFADEPPQTCEVPYNGPVTVIPVRTVAALRNSVAREPDHTLVYETDDTAIYDDGKVLTVALEDVGTHLNAVGWSANPIQILGTSVRPGGSNKNLGWNSSETTPGMKKRKKKKRRRG